MADETPPAPSESPDDATKTETIRITLPPKSEQPAVKRETVRINVPGAVAPSGTSPKKETTKLPTVSSSEGSAPPPPPPPPGSKPFIPPPPAPKPPPSAPGIPPVKPLAGANLPPKPPTLGARPTVPLKPAPGGGPGAGAEPITQKAASPKKETARITLPPEGSKAPLPKATVKMQQTQPLVNRPQSAITAAPVTSGVPGVVAEDSAINGMAIAALILSLVALATAYLAFAAASPS